MQQLAGRHIQARCPEVCLRDAFVNQWCSPGVYRCRASSRQQRLPYRLHVSCPAVEQDTEVASTSGRPHSDSELINSLLAHDPAAVMDVLDGQQQQQQPNLQKELIKRIKESGSLPLLCELVQAEAHHFDHKVTSQALHRLSVLCHAYFTQLQSAHLTSQEAQQAAWMKYVDPALKTLGQLLLQHMDSCDAWTVSISLWAYGHLQCSEETVLAALSERGSQLLHDFNTVDCSAALVGMAKLTGTRTRSQREFVEQLMTHTHLLLSHVDEWSARDITSIVWALSRLGAAGPQRRPLLQGLVEMALWRLHEFGVKELVITIYSLGRLRMRLPAQMVKLVNQIMHRLDELNPQDAANLVYSCAKVQFKQPELLQKLPHVMLDKLSSFKPQEVSNLLYGYGQLHYLHPLLLDSVAKACAPRLHEFSTQDLCLTVWSYGAVGYCPADTTLFEAACRALLQRKDRLLPLQITMVVKGFSRAGYQPPAAFMQQMSQLALAKLQQFSPLEYSQLLWAYSAAGYRDVQLFEAVVAHAIHQLHTKSHDVLKTTVDTILLACQGVGFWPQLLVDTAEMHGLYVRAKMQTDEQMEPLSPPVIAAVGAATAAAQATAAAAEAALAAADGSATSAVTAAAVAGHVSDSTAALASLDSDGFALAPAIAAALSFADEQGEGEVAGAASQQQQQPHSLPLQARQPSRLDAYGLLRPVLPQQRRQQQQPDHQQQQQQHEDSAPLLQQQQQQQQQHEQGQQQRDPPSQQGLNHPRLRAHLLPPPLLPQQQQHRSPAVNGSAVLHANGTSSSSSSEHDLQHSAHHSSTGTATAGSAGSSQPVLPQHLGGEGLIYPVGQQL